MKTGRVTVLTDAIARELITDASGKVTAVSYIDKTTGTERPSNAAAPWCSPRRRANRPVRRSTPSSSRHPDGLANANGIVGKYLTDSVGFGMSERPSPRRTPVHNTDGYGAHLYIPWWMWDCHKELNFARGYHVEVGGGGFGMPGLAFAPARITCTETRAADETGHSRVLRRHDDQPQRPWLDDPELRLFFCEIDPDVKDKWGIPVLRFHWRWSDHEINQVRHMRESFRTILESLGGTVNVGRWRRRRARPRRRASPAGWATRHPRWDRAAASSTRSAACEWATMSARACSTNSAGPTTCGTCLSPTRPPVCQPRREEPDAHDHRARMANGRVSRRGNEEGQCLR